ncbi:MAG TPA: 16S rRNA (cytosine(967)-C(5))-methyltransferase RsmB, partial [Azonexus sp.]|nr:16S rRNA (cytosine(967)-C(5))-methyltransferase RsmB [Azonexus sp.]
PEAEHTVVDQAVVAAGELAEGRFRGLVNGVLRNFLRQRDTLSAALADDAVARAQHPDWWLAHLQAAYPEDWPAIVAAGNEPPPMALRVNLRRCSRDAYQARLAAAGIPATPVGEAGLALAKPLPVERLPDFAEGLVSVQDPGAQLAAIRLDPAAGSRVLDACAAPGGKTAHLLERADLDLLALDLKPSRCRRVTENLDRLGLTAEVRSADCAKLNTWWDGRPFDAVLADVPCTASGVVRRNPDTKWLRREVDIASFAATQSRILDALWQVVRPGGKLLYVTCSVFPAENGEQIDAFLARQPLARRRHQEQLLPTAEHDGFFYCLLEKHA